MRYYSIDEFAQVSREKSENVNIQVLDQLDFYDWQTAINESGIFMDYDNVYDQHGKHGDSKLRVSV